MNVKFKPRTPAAGFTIVELMIATAVFSVVLTVVAAGVISFTRQYYRGITNNTTQNVTRSAMDEIVQVIEFNHDQPSQIAPDPSGTLGYCINSKPYYYVLGKKIGATGSNGTKHALVTTSGPCVSGVNLVSLDFATGPLKTQSPRELLGKNMRLTQFDITGADLQMIVLGVAYGDDDLLCAAPVTGSGCTNAAAVSAGFKGKPLSCLGGEGSQFCATVNLKASVVKRL